MSNRTDPLTRSVHGTNPQFLINQITRNRIYDSAYWKEYCFGLNAVTLLDKAAGLKYVGSVYGGNNKACPFLCLLLKLLQIGPSDSVVDEYMEQTDFKYLQALSAVYLRLTGSPERIYRKLEELYTDNRLLRLRLNNGSFKLFHVDEFIDELLHSNVCINIDLPPLPNRNLLEQNLSIRLEPRESMMMHEWNSIINNNVQDQFLKISFPAITNTLGSSTWFKTTTTITTAVGNNNATTVGSTVAETNQKT
ncbi:putative pre-mRNA splicing factor [Gregarina niphandrodes]|uniref:Pre-mRNA-splicing factor 38 n=1 Tax=Gregarina niphandrodes TaxID=110365 RepID=A0A023B5L5_GRENI|nr:putative pre-mRNA splicing factor [Gregarina niphandrodes]EZG60076.1 putative pre-mRNA splicing factor [Gregarina niphandrodes]|eukprot:XP_011130860.1 putative pre-mRNA splicing factor [Gregarina niphandrodes]